MAKVGNLGIISLSAVVKFSPSTKDFISTENLNMDIVVCVSLIGYISDE